MSAWAGVRRNTSRDLRYFRVTDKGRLFLRRAIPRVFLKLYKASLKYYAKTCRQDIASARRSLKSGTKEALSVIDVNDFSCYGISGNIRKIKKGV